MKNNNHSPKQSSRPLHDIPDIDIIDLENDGDTTPEDNENEAVFDIENDDNEDYDEDFEDDKPAKKGLKAFLNVHILFFVAVIGIVFIILFRFQNWGVEVDLDEIFKDGQGSYDNSMDSILPLMNERGEIVERDIEDPVIVAFGNAPFADDRDSEDNLCNLIAKETGATVYNCSISGSFLSTHNKHFDAETYPMDIYSFYWLATLAMGGPVEESFRLAEKELGDELPPEVTEVYNTLTTLDFNEVDVITIMYDASDYLYGRGMYNDENYTDVQTFTGNLEAGIELIQDNYPHIRFIVMSPSYAYAIDLEGNYVSSDMYTYGQDLLSTYSIMQSASCLRQSVSFVDHLYGTITEDNAEDYLIDNLHLNVEGRKLIAKRFEYFLNYYSKNYADLED